MMNRSILWMILMVALAGCVLPNGVRFGGGVANCSFMAWHQSIDQLPEPPYPTRDTTGDEHTLVVIVRDAETCQVIEGASVFFDMTNHEGVYDGTQQGATVTNALGMVVIRSNLPSGYDGGQPHIHLFLEADGYTPITTSYDRFGGASEAWFEIMLSPLA